MRYPWANVVLLFTILVLFISGLIGLINGQSRTAWVLWIHGSAAYMLLLLFVWKSSIILSAVQRKRVWTRQRVLFFILLALLITTIILGLSWTFYGPNTLGPFSLLSWHIYLAIPVMILMIWHSRQMKFIFRVTGVRDRRFFLGVLLPALVGTVAWRTAKWGKSILQLPATRRRFTGSYEQGSFTGHFPSVSWIADFPDMINSTKWQLTIDGAVKNAASFSLADLSAMRQITRDVVLDCTGGWYTEQKWQGVSLAYLLEQVEVLAEGQSVTITAVSGYNRRFNINEAAELLLALEVAGQPLSHAHGAPLRLVAPGHRGFAWVKWVSHIQVNSSSALLQSPLPLQ